MSAWFESFCIDAEVAINTTFVHSDSDAPPPTSSLLSGRTAAVLKADTPSAPSPTLAVADVNSSGAAAASNVFRSARARLCPPPPPRSAILSAVAAGGLGYVDVEEGN
jgi:hypothetical protein